MAYLNFPTNPSPGDYYTLNAKTWMWDGTVWKSATPVNLTYGIDGVISTNNGGTGLISSGATGNVLTSNGSYWFSSSPEVTANNTVTLTNKSISLSNNIISGTLTQFNAAVTDADLVSISGSETLTNKTIEGGTFTNGYTEETITTNIGSTYTIDLTNGTVQYLTLTASCVYTFPTPVAGKSFTLIQKQNATGGWTVTWPASVKWPSNTNPSITVTANKADKFIFTAIDGSSWLGSVAGQNYTV